MNIANRTKGLFAESGPVLFALRLPFRAFKVLADIINTRFYGLFLEEMGPGCRIEYGARIEGARNVAIGRNVRIGKATIIVSEIKTAKLRIGDRVHINRGCHIDHTGGLEIGEDSLLSEEAIIYSHSHGVDPHSIPQPIPKKIGKNCWIGARAMLMENAHTIADNTLVGAGSIVTKAIEDEGGVFAGVPAKRISDR